MIMTSQSDALTKLIKLSTTVAHDENLLSELVQEIKSGAKGAISNMFRALFKRKLLSDFGNFTEILTFFFNSPTITDFSLHDSAKLCVKCFFMPKNSSFPLHDHNNQVVCTGVLHGKIKYMSLDRVGKNKLVLSKKSTAGVSNVLFCTKEFRNVHSLLAVEDSVVIDVFMPNDEEEEFCLFKVVKKRQREFEMQEIFVRPHRRVQSGEGKSDS